MLLRYGALIVLLHTACIISQSPDEDTAEWVLNQTIALSSLIQPISQALTLVHPAPTTGTPHARLLTQRTILEHPTTTTKDPNDDNINLDPTNIESSVYCVLDDGRKGACVKYYQCNKNRTIIEDGSDIMDLRANNCPTIYETCCGFADLSDTDTSETFKTYESGTHSTVPEDECGWSNVLKSPEVESIYANFGEFRWMVAILMYGKENSNIWSSDDFIGGGTIIHPSVVITAAHKVYKEKAETLKCRAGEWDTQTEKEEYPFQERVVKTIVTHPNFFVVSVYNDVALLILQERFNLASAPHIGIACLMKQMPPPSTNCFTMGWGKLNGTRQHAQILKKLQMSLMSPEECQSNLQQSRLGRYFVLHESLTCAIGANDSCRNDGGSSLVCPIKVMGKYTRYGVVGMVAYGIGCNVKGRPGVYVNIPAMYSWINKTMFEYKYGTTTYEYGDKKN